MKVLVIAEHDHQHLKATTLPVITAAQVFKLPVEVIVVGYQCTEVVEQVRRLDGVSKVIVLDNLAYQHQFAENFAPVLTTLAADYQYLLAPCTTFGNDLLPRVAALLDVAQISAVTAIEGPDIFIRPIYAGNAFIKVQSHDSLKILTIRTTAFKPVNSTTDLATVEKLSCETVAEHTEWLSQESTVSVRPELSSARVVVAGGRGLQTAENFKLLEQLADKLGGAVGASRAAVDGGLAPNDYQIGQTGKVVAPDLYIAVGISGAIQHVAGIKDSKVIVAINKDPDAPIFKVADYGLVGDLLEIVPELMRQLRSV